MGRGNIGAHIESAFKNVPVGTLLTVAEIVNHVSDEYWSEPPSVGAVSQRLHPPKNRTCTVPGIVGVIDSRGRKAGKKVEA